MAADMRVEELGPTRRIIYTGHLKAMVDVDTGWAWMWLRVGTTFYSDLGALGDLEGFRKCPEKYEGEYIEIGRKIKSDQLAYHRRKESAT